MAEQSDASDKSFDPTQKKLEDARKKGELARSTDLNGTAMYLGMLLAAVSVGGGSLLQLGEVFSALIARADSMAVLTFEGRGAPVIGPASHAIVLALAPFAVIPMILVVGSIAAQRGFVFAGEKLKPKMSRISILQNAKNKFGSKGLFEFVKSTVKMVLFAWLLFAYLQFRFNDIVSAMFVTPEGATVKMLQFGIEFLSIVLVLSAVIGVIDYFWQRFEHLKQNRMSHKDMRDESKESEGDPHLKQARRSKAQQIALNSMLAEVPKADVVIVNPTHYAVALKWSRMPGSAPECVAKGVDEIALRIRSLATEADVPIHSDPPTARALHASVDLGQEIHPDHYKAVAAAIRFSEAMRAKAKRRVT